jgi:hypothetical protein
MSIMSKNITEDPPRPPKHLPSKILTAYSHLRPRMLEKDGLDTGTVTAGKEALLHFSLLVFLVWRWINSTINILFYGHSVNFLYIDFRPTN